MHNTPTHIVVELQRGVINVIHIRTKSEKKLSLSERQAMVEVKFF